VIYEFENKVKLKQGVNEDSKLRLKGQMKLIEELNQMFFLGHPV